MTALPPNDQPHRNAALWTELIAALDQDAMIALIGSWMGRPLSSQIAPEDLWQDTLAMAWRDRAAHDWRGMPAFRAWLRGIAQNRIKDTVERLSAQKRGGGHKIDSISGDSRRSEDGILPPVTTTPSREAGRHERARVLREAIDSLSDEYRDLVRMCLFEEMSVPMAAKLLSLADSTAYRRLLAGASMLRARVQSALGQGSWHEAKGP
jgi:RNA polymerase sigma factor (sigma-70 family)